MVFSILNNVLLLVLGAVLARIMQNSQASYYSAVPKMLQDFVATVLPKIFPGEFPPETMRHLSIHAVPKD